MKRKREKIQNLKNITKNTTLSFDFGIETLKENFP
jgi:hypothetical protein